MTFKIIANIRSVKVRESTEEQVSSYSEVMRRIKQNKQTKESMQGYLIPVDANAVSIS